MTSSSQLGNDITSKMLCAINASDDTEIKSRVQIEEQKSYLMKNLNTLDFASKIEIGNILRDHGLESHMAVCAEGTIVNLDTKGMESAIDQMYKLMVFKIRGVNAI